MAAIPGLYNTGDGVSAGQQDTHYCLVTPDGTVTFGYEATNNVFPVVDAAWGQQDTTSQWLTPTATQNSNVAVGDYYWSLYFDITGYNPATASLSGRAKADNAGIVYLNSVQIATGINFPDWVSFSASSGFRDGINELTFVINNSVGSPSPSGLRVEFTASDITAYDETVNTIDELYSTGAGYAQNAQDEHYLLSVLSGDTVLGAGQEHGYVVQDMEAPATGDPWAKNNHASRWLTPFNNASQTLDSTVYGVYLWRQEFTVTSTNKDAKITGRIMADNAYELRINNKFVDSYSQPSLPFDDWTEFEIQGELVVGTNYFDVLVTNYAQSTSNPTGLRVEIYYAALAPSIFTPNAMMFSCNT